MFFSKEERDLAIDLLECVNNAKEHNDCIHLVNKLKENKELYKYLNMFSFFNNVTKNILSFIAQDEALNIQSKRTKNGIQNLYIEFLHSDDKHLLACDTTLEEEIIFISEYEEKLYKDKYQEYKKEFFRDIEAPQKEKFHYGHNMSQLEDEWSMKRKGFEYERIHDYQDFELNNNIAHEFAKRKYSMLYIYEHIHIKKVLAWLFRYTLPQKIDNVPYDKTPKVACVCDFETDTINQMIKNFRAGKSFFNVMNSLYRTHTIELTEEELLAREHGMYFKEVKNKTNKTMSTITPIFRLPKLEESLQWEVSVKLNLALPEEQLMAYIKHLKKSVSKTWSVKGGKFLSAINLEDYDINLIKKFSKNIRKKNRIHIIIADILFTYDCLKLNFTKQEIAQELNNYHFEKGYSKGVNFPDDIVTAYTNVAISMIEEENYKKLVNGI